jgi:CrcB protein
VVRVNLLLVIIGAAVGAPLRYLTDRAVQSRRSGPFPLGTLTVNIVASLVLGFVTGGVANAAVSHQVQLAIGTGLCATLSTYSTFAFETVRLLQNGERRAAVSNVVVSLVVGIAAAFAGVGLANAIWR